MRDTDNSADILDIRNLIERIEDLESEQDGLIEEFETAADALHEAFIEWQNAEPIDQHNGVDPSGDLTKARDEAAAALVEYWNGEEHREPGESTADLANRLLEAYRDKADKFTGEEELAALVAFVGEFKGYGGDHQWRGDWYPVTFIHDSYWKEYAQEFAEDIGAIDRDARWPNDCIDWDKAARELQIDYTSGEFDGVTYWAR